MMHLGFRGLLLGLLVTWVAVGETTVQSVLAHREIATLANKRQTVGSDQELGDKTKAVHAGGSKWVGRRKMGVEDVMKMEVRGTMNAGKTKISLDDSVGSSNMKDTTNSKPKSRPSTNTDMKVQGSAPDPLSLSSSSRQGKPNVSESSVPANLESPTTSKLSTSQGSYDASQIIAGQNLQEATAELFRTLSKDYHSKGRRRPPINNNLPLLGDNNVNP